MRGMAAPANAAHSADLVIVVGLGAAISYATLAQGAYYPRGLLPVLVMVGLAVVARAVVRRRRVDAPVAVAAGCFLAFALWNLTLGWFQNDLGAALPAVTVACCVAAAAVAVTGLPDPSRRVLQLAVVALGVGVAGSAWIGVALHAPPLALPSSELWRGASTLTYANAAAAFLVVAAVVALAVLAPRRWTNAVLAVLLVGLMTTMSRAGALGLLVALGAYLVLTPDRSRLRAALPAVPAAALAAAGLLPSVTAAAAPRPLVALLGAAAGLAVILVAPWLRPRHLAIPAALLTGLLAVAVTLPSARDAAGEIAGARLSAASAERGDLTRVTAEQFRSFPLTGVGPGRLDLRYVDHTGTRVRAVHTHNEYLQTAAETGVVGVGLAVAGIGALAFAGARLRTREGAAAAAVVAGFAVHSAFDFLWHIPVLPLLLTLSVVALTTNVRSPDRKDPVPDEDHAEGIPPGRAGAGAR
jgi:hypothetical protein